MPGSIGDPFFHGTEVRVLTVGALRLLRGCCSARGRNAWFSTSNSIDWYSADPSGLTIGATDDFCMTVKFPAIKSVKDPTLHLLSVDFG